MSTLPPAPTPMLRVRQDVLSLGNALAATPPGAVRTALLTGLIALFDSATAAPAVTPAPAPASDTNGSAPAEVERALFPDSGHQLNGFDPPERD